MDLCRFGTDVRLAHLTSSCPVLVSLSHPLHSRIETVKKWNNCQSKLSFWGSLGDTGHDEETGRETTKEMTEEEQVLPDVPRVRINYRYAVQHRQNSPDPEIYMFPGLCSGSHGHVYV